jgi:hypothetical protein
LKLRLKEDVLMLKDYVLETLLQLLPLPPQGNVLKRSKLKEEDAILLLW